MDVNGPPYRRAPAHRVLDWSREMLKSARNRREGIRPQRQTPPANGCSRTHRACYSSPYRNFNFLARRNLYDRACRSVKQSVVTCPCAGAIRHADTQCRRKAAPCCARSVIAFDHAVERVQTLAAIREGPDAKAIDAIGAIPLSRADRVGHPLLCGVFHRCGQHARTLRGGMHDCRSQIMRRRSSSSPGPETIHDSLRAAMAGFGTAGQRNAGFGGAHRGRRG